MKRLRILLLVCILLNIVALSVVANANNEIVASKYSSVYELDIDCTYGYNVELDLSVKRLSEANQFVLYVSFMNKDGRFLGTNVVDVSNIDYDTKTIHCRFKSEPNAEKAYIIIFDNEVNIEPVLAKRIDVFRENVSGDIALVGDYILNKDKVYNSMNDNLNSIETSGTVNIESTLGAMVEGKADIQTVTITDSVLPTINNKDLLIIDMSGDENMRPVDEVIGECNNIISQLDYSTKAYIIIGYMHGTDITQKHFDEQMVSAFGENYFNIRKYLSSQATVADAKLNELSFEDNYFISKGRVPECFRSDEIHLNATGYKIASKAIYEKLDGLCYIEK